MKNIFKIISINILILFALLLMGEVITRIFISYNPSYYTSLSMKNGCKEYAYGTLCFNSMGYPDEEFDLNSGKKRVGYFGDSVCAGLGAGQGHRIPDLLERHYDGYEHWVFCKYGSPAMTRVQISRILKNIGRYGLSKVVYMMNLNDIAPSVADKGEMANVPNVTGLKRSFKSLKLDWLRGRSYLYTYTRNVFKSYLTVKGYQHSGYQAIEFFPNENIDLLEDFSGRILELGKELRNKDVEFIVVILPYEMQASRDAAEKYSAIGIQWEEGFLSGSTQQFLMEALGEDKILKILNVVDAFEELEPTSRAGEYFVFNRGDKIDWNHPNRKGHQVISDYLIGQDIFEE